MKPSTRRPSPRGPLSALGLFAGIITAGLITAVAAEAARIAWLEGLSAVPGGLSSIVTGAWLTDCLVLTLSILFFWALTGRLSLGLVTSATLTGLLLFAHVQKTRAIGKPLAMSDLALVGDVLSVMGGVLRANLGAFIGLGLCLAAALATFILLLRQSPRLPLTRPGRVALLGIVIAFFASGILEPPKDNDAGIFFRDESINGFLMNFIRSPRVSFKKPAHYHSKVVAKLLDKHVKATHPVEDSLRPDIIFYLGESFMDLERLQFVQFNREATPHFHRIIQNTLSGRLSSPEAGGATANVEFEVHTGLPIAVLPPNAVPYHHNIHRNIASSIQVLANKNYQTHGFHNYDGNNYGRNIIYPRLGFDTFQDLSQMTPHRPQNNGDASSMNDFLDGPFPSDEPLAHHLIERLNSAQTPVFLFGLGMVSHGGYDGWPEEQKTVRIVSEGLSPSTKESLEHLANALNRADIALGYLIRAVESRKRPTILFFMGDHLPYISDSVLREGGFDFGDKGQRRYEVPFFVLANFPLPDLDIPDRMSAFYLPSKILRAAGIDGGPYFRFLESKLDQITAMNHNFLLLPDGREFAGPRDPKIPPDVALMVNQTLEDFSLLAWDRLEGEGYSFFDGR